MQHVFSSAHGGRGRANSGKSLRHFFGPLLRRTPLSPAYHLAVAFYALVLLLVVLLNLLLVVLLPPTCGLALNSPPPIPFDTHPCISLLNVRPARKCAPHSNNRPSWTVVGVQTQAQTQHMSSIETNEPDGRITGRLFTKVSSQIDWIVDTMSK